MRIFIWIILAGLAFPAQATMYKWVDAQGRTHYGDTLPPQASGRANAILDKQAQTIRHNAGTLSAAQREAQAAEQERQNKALLIKTEQQRRDTALLNTYTTPGEIDLARDRNLEQARLMLNSTLAQRKQVHARQMQLARQVERLVSSQGAIPSHLVDLQKTNAREIKFLDQAIAQKRMEMAATRARFEADRARFIELSTIADNRP